MLWFLKNALILAIILVVVSCLWAVLINKEDRKTMPRLGAFWIVLCVGAWTVLFFTVIASNLSNII